MYIYLHLSLWFDPVFSTRDVSGCRAWRIRLTTSPLTLRPQAATRIPSALALPSQL